MLDTSPKSRTNAVNYEFVKFQRPLFKCFFVLLVFVLCLYTVWTFIWAKTYVKPLEVAITVVPLILAIAASTRWMNFRFMEFFIMIICLIVYSLYFQTQYTTVESNRDLSFGYLIAFFERMVLERLPMFSHKVMFAGFAIIVRSLFMGVTDIYDSLLRVTLLVFGFILDFTKEKKEKELYRFYYDSKESFNCAKNMLKTYVTDNILIVSPDLKKTLFTNDVLYRTFAFSPSAIKDFLQSFELQKGELSRAPTGFVRLKDKTKPEIELEKIDIEDDSQKQEESMISESQNNIETIAPMTLYSYLETAMKAREAFEEPFGYLYNYSVKHDENVKKTKVKVTPSYWQGEACLCIVIKDLSDQFALRGLAKDEKHKEKVLATVSHELRTPLNGILGIVQIMEKEILQPRFVRYLKTCKNSAKLLLSLVNSILDISQLKNNKLKLTPATHKIKDILDDILSLFDFQCQAKQLYLRVEMGSGLPKVIYTDRNRLAQILINLIGNALKFTFEGGIIISVERDIIDPYGIRFSVSDTGVGIEDKDKSKLLKQYGKLEGTAQFNPQGVGLGLNISNQLASLLNEGDEDSGIKIESEFQKGSTFSFLIKERLYSNGIIEPQELDVISPKSYKSSTKSTKSSMNTLRKDKTLHVETGRIKTLEFERKDSYGITMETTEGNAELLPKSKNSKMNNSQASQETPRYTKNLNTNTKEAYSTVGNLDQTYASPREHLLSHGNQPFSPPGKSRFLSIDNAPQILIIDDNPFNLMIAKELIEAQGISVLTALNGQAGIDQVMKRHHEKQSFRLILMDCEMPVMNGFEATKNLVKKMAKGEIYNVPIVALTANSVETIKNKCLKAGMADCLSKPLVEDDLKALITKYLKDSPRAALKKYT